MADGQPTGEIADRRRPSEFFVPIARPKKMSAAQLTMYSYGGSPDTTLPWVVQDLAGYRLALVGAAILDDATQNAAASSRRLTADDFADLMGE